MCTPPNRSNVIATTRSQSARPPQIGDERHDLSMRPAASGGRFHIGNIRLDVADRDDIVPNLRQAEGHGPAKPAQSARDNRNPLFHGRSSESCHNEVVRQ